MCDQSLAFEGFDLFGLLKTVDRLGQVTLGSVNITEFDDGFTVEGVTLDDLGE